MRFLNPRTFKWQSKEIAKRSRRWWKKRFMFNDLLYVVDELIKLFCIRTLTSIVNCLLSFSIHLNRATHTHIHTKPADRRKNLNIFAYFFVCFIQVNGMRWLRVWITVVTRIPILMSWCYFNIFIFYFITKLSFSLKHTHTHTAPTIWLTPIKNQPIKIRYSIELFDWDSSRIYLKQ